MKTKKDEFNHRLLVEPVDIFILKLRENTIILISRIILRKIYNTTNSSA